MKVAGFDIGGANTDLAVVDFENRRQQPQFNEKLISFEERKQQIEAKKKTISIEEYKKKKQNNADIEIG